MRRDLIALPDDSKVWIYQAKQPLDEQSSQAIKDSLYDFSMQWKSHGQDIDSYAHLFHNQFIVLVADGSQLPSGCSIDSSVHFITELGNKYKADFFDRMTFAYLEDDHVKTISNVEFKNAYTSNLVSKETLMFDNLVTNKKDFLEKWILPLEESWHTKFLN